jgi:outer membrane lipase/esterase
MTKALRGTLLRATSTAIAVAAGTIGTGHAGDLPPYVVVAGGGGLTTLPGMNSVQSQMATSIDNVCPTIVTNAVTPDQKDLGNICSVMTGSAVVALGQANPLSLPSLPLSVDGIKNALQQINGGGSLITPTSQVGALRNTQTQGVGARLSVLRMRMMGDAAPPDPSQSLQYAMNDGATLRDGGSGLQVAQGAPTETSMWAGKLGLFANLLGQFGDSDPTTHQDGYSFYNVGFLAGGDYQFTPKLAIGLAFGYTYTNTDFDVTPAQAPNQFLHGNLFQGNLYANYYATDALYLDAIASIGGGDNDSQRQIIIPGLPGGADRFATGSFGSRTYGLAVGGGYNIPMGAWTLTPTARLEFHRVESDGFTETGANGLDLTYGNSGQNAFLSFIGGQASYAISTSFGVLTPTAKLQWAHQYNRGQGTVTIAYSNDPSLLSSFTLPGDTPSRDYGDIGIGLAAQFAGNMSGFINYDAIVGISNTSYNSFTAGLRFNF